MKQKTNPGKGALNRCYHATNPTAHEDVKSFLKGVEREAPPQRQRKRRSRSGVRKTYKLNP